MSEGTPIADLQQQLAIENPSPVPPKKTKTLLIAGGTVVVLLVAGIVFQWARANQVDADQVQSRSANRAGARTQTAAKITTGSRTIKIPLDDVAQECLRRVGTEVLDSMINRAIIQLACEEKGVTVTQAEVEQEIIRIAKQFNIPVESWLQMLEIERGVTSAQYSRDVIWPMLALKKLAGNSVRVTKKDMHKAFVRNYGPKVKCRMIMTDNVRRANEVWSKIKLRPTDFGRLAREYSIDPNSRALEGSIPPIARYSGNDKLEQAAFKLKEGEVSGIINIGFNRFVILRCEGYTKQLVTDPKEVERQLYEDLVEDKIKEAVALLFEDLKTEATIVNNWTQTTTEGRKIKQTFGTRAGKSRVQPATGTQFKGPTPNRAATQKKR
jgi:foldase protein PrsA